MPSQDWLSDFVAAKSYGECGERILYWTGISTIAGALRRKVWLDFEDYQWTPNFYILFVGEPGIVKKSTSIDMGMRLLGEVPGINFGPEIVTWQSLIQHIGQNRDAVVFDDPDRPFFHSSVTIALSEFGTFFKPEDQDLVSNLINLWDGKLGTITKKTKKDIDELVNAFINIIAGTTPDWMANNFPASMIGGGWASRSVILNVKDSGIDVAYPTRNPRRPSREIMAAKQQELAENLCIIAEYQGEYVLTEAAWAWGEAWYKPYRKQLRETNDKLVRGFLARKQTHLHKLAMIISAARYKFPVIDVPEMEEADRVLATLDKDVEEIFGIIGQSKITQAAAQIVDVIVKQGVIDRGTLYRKYFFRTMTANEFREALNSAMMSRLIVEVAGQGLKARSVPPPLVRLVQ